MRTETPPPPPAAPEHPTIPAIQVRGLTRSFGATRALAGFDAEVPWGQVTALVGPNGAGKTTLLLVLAGLLAPDSGEVRIAGLDPVTEPYKVHKAIGWMPDFFGVYDDLTPREYLQLFASAYRMSDEEGTARAAELVNTVGLGQFADKPVHTLSRGQKQRLGFARTIVHEPKVLLLDEPAAGLDPRARIDLRDLVRGQADAGVAVVISSHILAELEEMSDHVVFVDAGKSKGMYSIRDLPRGETVATWRLRALDSTALEATLEKSGATWRRLPSTAVSVTIDGEDAAAELIARLVGGGVKLVEATPEHGGLEQAFLSMEGPPR